jgi:hypothetical protein
MQNLAVRLHEYTEIIPPIQWILGNIGIRMEHIAEHKAKHQPEDVKC